MGWVLPAMPIVSWMSRPDRVESQLAIAAASASPARRQHPDSITRIMRSERSRPSQAMRGSACRLVRPAASTMPGMRRYRAGKAGLLRHHDVLRGERQRDRRTDRRNA